MHDDLRPVARPITHLAHHGLKDATAAALCGYGWSSIDELDAAIKHRESLVEPEPLHIYLGADPGAGGRQLGPMGAQRTTEAIWNYRQGIVQRPTTGPVDITANAIIAEIEQGTREHAEPLPNNRMIAENYGIPEHLANKVPWRLNLRGYAANAGSESNWIVINPRLPYMVDMPGSSWAARFHETTELLRHNAGSLSDTDGTAMAGMRLLRPIKSLRWQHAERVVNIEANDDGGWTRSMPPVRRPVRIAVTGPGTGGQQKWTWTSTELGQQPQTRTFNDAIHIRLPGGNDYNIFLESDTHVAAPEDAHDHLHDR